MYLYLQFIQDVLTFAGFPGCTYIWRLYTYICRLSRMHLHLQVIHLHLQVFHDHLRLQTGLTQFVCDVIVDLRSDAEGDLVTEGRGLGPETHLQRHSDIYNMSRDRLTPLTQHQQ